MRQLLLGSLRLALIVAFIPVAAGLGAVGGFFGALHFLESNVSDQKTVEPVVTPSPAPPPDAAQLERLLADEPVEAETVRPAPPPAPPAADTVLRQVIAAIRLHKPVEPTKAGSLSCEDLSGSRNMLWAMNGYSFKTEEAAAWLIKQQGGVRGDPSVSSAQVLAALTPVDIANRDVLDSALAARSCPCAGTPVEEPCPG